jgi:hypothetical protein
MQDTLRELAEDTDGKAIVNRNALAEGLDQILRDSSLYYLLGYSSTVAQADGKFHQYSRAREAAEDRCSRPQGLLGIDRRGREPRGESDARRSAAGRRGPGHNRCTHS